LWHRHSCLCPIVPCSLVLRVSVIGFVFPIARDHGDPLLCPILFFSASPRFRPWALTFSRHARWRHSRRSLTALCLTLGWPFRFRTISGPFPDLSCRSLLPQLPFKSLLSISAIFGNTGDHGDSRHPPLPPYVHPFPPKVTQSTQASAEGRNPKSTKRNGDSVAPDDGSCGTAALGCAFCSLTRIGQRSLKIKEKFRSRVCD
jgi:hypothetical protein